MSEHFNLNLDYKNLNNEFLSKDEKINLTKEFNLPKKFSLIQSVSRVLSQRIKVKLEGMQYIVNYFNKINWIQIGLSLNQSLKIVKSI